MRDVAWALAQFALGIGAGIVLVALGLRIGAAL